MDLVEMVTSISPTEASTIITNRRHSAMSFVVTKSLTSLVLGRIGQSLMTTRIGMTKKLHAKNWNNRD